MEFFWFVFQLSVVLLQDIPKCSGLKQGLFFWFYGYPGGPSAGSYLGSLMQLSPTGRTSATRAQLQSSGSIVFHPSVLYSTAFSRWYSKRMNCLEAQVFNQAPACVLFADVSLAQASPWPSPSSTLRKRKGMDMGKCDSLGALTIIPYPRSQSTDL